MDSNSSSTVKGESHPLFTFIKVTPERSRLTFEIFLEMVPYRIYLCLDEQSIVLYCNLALLFQTCPLNDVKFSFG